MRGINPFVEFLEQISKIYNEPIEVLIDNKNLYLIEGEKQNKISLNLKGYDIKMILNNKYNIITLCGSIKFKDEFMKVQEKLTLEGNIVLIPNFFTNIKKEDINLEFKNMLDKMHKQKIDMSNEIYVINIGGYIGESTKSEIEYAKSKGKKIFYIE